MPGFVLTYKRVGLPPTDGVIRVRAVAGARLPVGLGLDPVR